MKSKQLQLSASEKRQLLQIIDGFSRARILGIGDFILDVTGAAKDGLFDDNCYYTAADESYKFDGLFSAGLPLPHLEAAYVYLQLDRSNAIVKVLEEPVPAITPGKKTPGSAKKTKVVEVEVQQRTLVTNNR